MGRKLADLERDSEGYLKNQGDWDPEIAGELAAEDSLALTEEHWELIRFEREFYRQFNTTPAIRMLTRAVREKFGEDKGSSIYLHKMFPGGPAKQLAKIAGLPKPVKCI